MAHTTAHGRVDEARVARIPPTPETIRAWFARRLAGGDAARIEGDVTALCEDLRKRVYVDFITMESEGAHARG